MRREIQIAKADGFIILDQTKDHLIWESPRLDERYFTFKRRASNDLKDIFRSFVTPDILASALDQFDYEDYILANKSSWHHIPSIQELYIALAITIRIQGLHRTPQKIAKNTEPLREAIRDAKDYFQKLNPRLSIPGINILSKIIAMPLFSATMYEDICKNFQNIVFQIGETCAGDEKLFHFTGKTKDIRLVPNKPGRIGLWNYELCAPLPHGGQFLLHTRMSHGGETVHVSEIVKKWTDIINQYDRNNTLLTFDSYYMDNSSRKVLADSGVKYVASFSSSRFKAFTDIMTHQVANPGEWTGLYNPETSESVIYHWSNDRNIGKKWVMSNACQKNVKGQNTTSIPLFDLYKVTF